MELIDICIIAGFGVIAGAIGMLVIVSIAVVLDNSGGRHNNDD